MREALAPRSCVTKRKWFIGDARTPTLARRDGVIEAVARTPSWASRRRRDPRNPDGQGTRVDVRSASRYGTHDLGANASRIRRLLADIDDAAVPAPLPPVVARAESAAGKKEPA